MAEPALPVTQGLPADWRARLRSGLRSAPDHRPEQSRYGALPASVPDALSAQLRASLPATLKAAAVLVPIVEHAAAPTLLLTVRADHLRRHPGQISFPGGRLEARDADLAAAALRETEEEIGIQAAFIEPIGFLSDQVAQSGYRVTPVVALLQPGFTLQPDDTEVADIFELPLAFALAGGNYRARRRMLREIEVEVWELPFGERLIWGLTATVLANLREVISGDAA